MHFVHSIVFLIVLNSVLVIVFVSFKGYKFERRGKETFMSGRQLPPYVSKTLVREDGHHRHVIVHLWLSYESGDQYLGCSC